MDSAAQSSLTSAVAAELGLPEPYVTVEGMRAASVVVDMKAFAARSGDGDVPTVAAITTRLSDPDSFVAGVNGRLSASAVLVVAVSRPVVAVPPLPPPSPPSAPPSPPPAESPFVGASVASVQPFGLATGSETALGVEGSGFGGMLLASNAVRCALSRNSEELWVGPVVVRSPTSAECIVPAGAVRTEGSLTLSFVTTLVDPTSGGPWPPMAAPTALEAYDDTAVSVVSMSPSAGPKGTATAVNITGANFEDFGGIRVRLGAMEPVVGTVVDSSTIAATLPAVSPATEAVHFDVSVALNGQAFSGQASFTAYAAVLREAHPMGAPTGAAEAVLLLGSGFVNLGATRCIYRPIEGGGNDRVSEGTIVNASAVRCPAPAAALAGAYTLHLSLDGGAHVVPELFGSLPFAFYNLAEVAISSFAPLGGPVAGGTAVTLVGSNLLSYGDGQLCCSFGSTGCNSRARTLPGSEDGATRVACVAPTAASAGPVTLSLSLNAGAAGTFVTAPDSFHAYDHPTVTALSPAVGSALGGTQVTLTGSGFTTLSLAAAVDATSTVRVRFGGAIAEAPVSVSDSQVVVLSTYGSEGVHPVAVSLNGAVDFQEVSDLAFEFVGKHAPRLVSAAFNAAATAVVLSFDDQPTDRAGKAGVFPCAEVVDDATALVLRGTYSEAATCHWEDDSTLVAALNVRSAIRAGDTVTLRPGSVRPAGVHVECPHPLCAEGSALISVDNPCNGACTPPTASVSGPTTVSSCGEAALRLDASTSSGGGILPLTYVWALDPSRSDDVTAIDGQLASFSGPVVEVSGFTGTQYVFLVRAHSEMLDVTSEPVEWLVTRVSGTPPTVTIDGAPTITTRPSSPLVLSGVATVAECWNASASASAVAYNWTHTATRDAATGLTAAGVEMLSLPGGTKATIVVPAFSLAPGLVYTFSLTASMAIEPMASSTATIEVMVEAEPLRAVIAGGDRKVSRAELLEVDGSQSSNPNVLPAEQELVFRWVVRQSAEGDVVAVDGADNATLSVAAGTLDVGNYTVELTISASGASPAVAAVTLVVIAGNVPAISFEPLNRHKFNPTWSLPTERLVLQSTVDAETQSLVNQGLLALGYRWEVFEEVAGVLVASELDLADDTRVTTTGNGRPSLAFRSGALVAGARYAFALHVTGAENAAFAQVHVVMNAPPFGGELSVTPATGGVALKTLFAFEALGWTDVAEDLPLRFAFGLRREGQATAETLADLTRASSLYAPLPAGNHTGTVEVVDFYGGRAMAVASVQVEVPDNLNDGDIDSALVDAETAAASGMGSSANQLVAVLADLIASDSGSGTSRRRRLNEASSARAQQLVTTMLTVTKLVADNTLSTPEARRQRASVLGVVLQDPEALDGAAQAEGVGQAATLSSECATAGLDDLTADAILGSVNAALGANESTLSPAERTAVSSAATSTAENLAVAFMAGAVAGEGPRESVGASFSVSARRETTAELERSALVGPGGQGGVQLGPGVFSGQDAGDVADGVDVRIHTFARNLFEEPAAQGTGLGGLQSGVFSVSLAAPAATGGSVLTITAVPEPIVITVPTTTKRGSGSTAGCFFWDVHLEAWSSEGCTAVAADDASSLKCLCTHLTDFAAITVPTSTEELEKEVKSVSVNTFSAEQAAAVLTDVNFEENPHIYLLVYCLAGGNAFFLLLAFLVDRKVSRSYRAWQEEQKAVTETKGPMHSAAKADPTKRTVARTEQVAKSIGKAMDKAAQLRDEAQRKAAVVVQRHARGNIARRASAKVKELEAKKVEREAKKSNPTFTGKLVDSITGEHTVLALFFAPPDATLQRTELVQIFFNMLVLEVRRRRLARAVAGSRAQAPPRPCLERPPGGDRVLALFRCARRWLHQARHPRHLRTHRCGSRGAGTHPLQDYFHAGRGQERPGGESLLPGLPSAERHGRRGEARPQAPGLGQEGSCVRL